MSKEYPQPEDVYGFTEREQLWDRITDGRFNAIIADEQTVVHRIELSSNNYGEFLFVATSRGAGERRVCITFFGCGYHDYRERWITGEWFWYRANEFPEVLRQEVSKEEAQEVLRERRAEIASYTSQQTQSGRGRLFEMLADLLDEDGAISEMEDMDDDLAEWLSDGLE
jgi:hypothetical protein